MMKCIHNVRMDAVCAQCADDNRMNDELDDNIDHRIRAPQIKDILCDSLNQSKKEADLNIVISNHVTNAENALIAKLYECVASHYENGDRTGAEAILNVIQYAQQKD